jgi:hypothetical protein
MQETWLVSVGVRKRGAIGVFGPMTFGVTVDLPIANVTRAVLFDAWQEQYGHLWEPDHFLQGTHKEAGVIVK